MAVVEVGDELGDDDPHAANPKAPTTVATAQTALCFPMYPYALRPRAALWTAAPGTI